MDVSRMPFTKRWPYRCEEEFRMLWESQEHRDSYELDIDLSLIRRITISQHMPRPVYQTIKSYLKEAFADPDKRIHRSTLLENKRWIASFTKA
jgi:hypothetical protein